MERRFDLDDTATLPRPARFQVLLDHVHIFDDDTVLLRDRPSDPAALSFVFTGDHEDLVALSPVHSSLSVVSDQYQYRNRLLCHLASDYCSTMSPVRARRSS